jgi:hypothetical protein
VALLYSLQMNDLLSRLTFLTMFYYPKLSDVQVFRAGVVLKEISICQIGNLRFGTIKILKKETKK